MYNVGKFVWALADYYDFPPKSICRKKNPDQNQLCVKTESKRTRWVYDRESLMDRCSDLKYSRTARSARVVGGQLGKVVGLGRQLRLNDLTSQPDTQWREVAYRA